MTITDYKVEYEVLKEQNNIGIPVIIVAAGMSSRMNGTDKQFLSLMGIPVIARTLMAFERCEFVSRIILVTRAEQIEKMQVINEQYMISKLSDIVPGGNSRHESVICGMKMLKPDENKVIIHDGARPFADCRLIAGCVKELDKSDACLCAVPVKDTVKKVGDGGKVISTVDRSGLYLAQTPQGVHVDLYKKACDQFGNAVFTDDASVMEAAGYSVSIVEGDEKNIKITTKDDILIAETIIKGE